MSVTPPLHDGDEVIGPGFGYSLPVHSMALLRTVRGPGTAGSTGR